MLSLPINSKHFLLQVHGSPTLLALLILSSLVFFAWYKYSFPLFLAAFNTFFFQIFGLGSLILDLLTPKFGSSCLTLLTGDVVFFKDFLISSIVCFLAPVFSKSSTKLTTSLITSGVCGVILSLPLLTLFPFLSLGYSFLTPWPLDVLLTPLPNCWCLFKEPRFLPPFCLMGDWLWVLPRLPTGVDSAGGINDWSSSLST